MKQEPTTVYELEQRRIDELEKRIQKLERKLQNKEKRLLNLEDRLFRIDGSMPSPWCKKRVYPRRG